jgi:hypothetical protein
MNLTEIKTFVRNCLTEGQIKAFGYDLRTREAWETLADRCKEYAIATIESTRPSAEAVYDSFTPQGETVCEIGLAGIKAIYHALTSEKAQNIYKTAAIVVACMAVVIVLGFARAAQQLWQTRGMLYWAKAQDKAAVLKPKILDWRDITKQRIESEYQNWVSLMLSLWQGV